MLSATTKRRVKICGCTFAAAVIGALVWFAVEFYLYVRDLHDWGRQNAYHNFYVNLFLDRPELAAKLSESPLEVTGLSLEPFGQGAPPYRDRYGKPMRFFLIRWNGRIYGKCISAGRDGKFGTADDIVSSDYDDTNNPPYLPRVDIEKKKYVLEIPPTDVPSARK